MLNRTYNFSVKPSDRLTIKLLKEIKKFSIKNGVSFSFICIEALKNYKEKVLDNDGRN